MKKALVFSLAAMAVGVAQAQFYAGIEAGTAKTDLSNAKSNVEASWADFGLPITVAADESTSAFRVFGGIPMNSKTNIEMGVFGTGETSVKANGRIFGISYNEEFIYSANGFDVSGLFKPTSGGFFLKGGLHASKIEVDYSGSVAGNSVGTESDSESGIGFLYGLGYEAAIIESLNLRASFVRYQKLGGESDVDLDVISLGVSKRF